jgi:cellobiose phosphorylase
VTAGNIEGPESPFYGRGGWTWYSGSAAWLFRVGLEWILGVRPSIDGLIVDPCIPASWEGYTVSRLFRGAEYSITVRNPAHVECGVQQIFVDGDRRAKTGRVRHAKLPVLPAGSVHDIVIVMGRM